MEQKNDVISYLAQLPAQKLHPAIVLSNIRKRHIICIYYKQLLIVTHKGIPSALPVCHGFAIQYGAIGYEKCGGRNGYN